MKKSRTKFLSIFAILLVAIFAVSCCFFVACGNKEDEGEDETPHTHSYTKYDYDEESHWYVCPDDGDVDEATVTAHTWKESGTTEASCIAYASTTYTCECGATKTEYGTEYADHTYAVAFTWAEDYSGATAAYTCSVCGDVDEDSVTEATVTSTDDETGTTYKATATIDEKEYSDEKFVAAVVEPEPVEYTQSRVYDFDDPDTYENFMKPAEDGKLASGNYVSGIVTFVTKSDGTSSVEAKEFDDDTTRGAWVPNGKSGSACYVGIDLDDYIGEYVKIEVEFAANAAAESGRSLYVGTSNVDASNSSNASKLIAETQTTSYDVTDVKTLVFETEVTSTYKALYLDSDASLCFYKITVSLTGEVDPWANEGTTNPDDNPQKSTEAIASFFVPEATDAESAATGSFSASTAIDDNETFTLTAGVDMSYAYGTAFGNLQNIGDDGAAGSNAVSYSKLNGDTVNPYQGLESTTIAKTATAEDTEEVTYTHVDNIISVTAKANITIYVYVTLADNGYTGNRTGYVYGCIGTTVAFSEAASARKTVITITADLQTGETLTIGALNTHSSDARLWLFGAEATAL